MHFHSKRRGNRLCWRDNSTTLTTEAQEIILLGSNLDNRKSQDILMGMA
jgi:hypothetical protein